MPVNGFSGDGLSPKESDAKEFVRKLLKWRQGQEVVHSGSLMHYVPIGGVYVYFRYNADETVMVILNKNANEVSLDLDRFDLRIDHHSTATDVIHDKTFDLGGSIMVPAWDVMVLELD